ncbi:MAG TPA: hypothetical protein VIU41_10400 [Geobacteraceae bacterium]
MKKAIIGITVAVGMLSVGALSASAAGPCCATGRCSDKQTVQQFTQETSGLASALNVKKIELREQYGYDGLDQRKVNELEAEVKELTDKVKTAGEKHGLPACCLS